MALSCPDSTYVDRIVAYRVLVNYHFAQGPFIEQLLSESFVHHPQLSSVQRAFVQHLVYGVVRYKNYLDFYLNEQIHSPIKTVHPRILALLRMAAFELLKSPQTPAYAIVHSAVEVAKLELKQPKKVRFVNAVLRNMKRDYPEKKLEKNSKDKVYYDSIRYSCHERLVRYLVKSFGEKRSEEILKQSLQVPKMWIRTNLLKTSPDALKERLQEEGIGYEACADHGELFAISKPGDLAKSEAFKEGWFYVQDRQTLRAAEALGVQAGDLVLDGCAAPGGKSAYLAQFLKSPSQLTAVDISAPRLKKLKSNFDRLGISGVQVVQADLRDLQGSCQFDRILVDVPCSNLGVLSRRIDVRWRLRPEQLEELVLVQRAILNRMLTLLKPGGTLVYSTCTLAPEENEGVIEACLKQHPQCVCVSQTTYWPEEDSDGGFIAVLTLSKS